MTSAPDTHQQDISIGLKDLGLVLAMNIAWGGNFVVSKFAVTELPPIFSAGVRFAIVALVCLPWLKPLYGRMKAVLTIAMLMGFIHFSLLFIALEMSNKISAMAIIAQLGVPLSVIMAVVLLGERVGIYRITGIALAFGGAVLLGFDPEIFNDLPAVTVMFISVVIMSYCAILMRNLRGVAPLELQAWIGVSSFAPLFALSAVVEWGRFDQVLNASWTGWVAVIYSAVISSVLAHAINFYLIQRYPVSTVAPYSLLAPVVGVLTSVWLLGDQLTWQLVLGGVITLGGVLLITLRSSKKPSPAPKASKEEGALS
ncbi:MAG: EamA family transporter [Pseudomonadota bacterium]